MHLFLVRHGETEWNVEKLCQGHTDVPLNEQGLAQADKLARFMQETQIDAIYASDLCRATQTAEIIAQYHKLDVLKMPTLRERYYGEWEGLTLEQINRRYPDQLQVRKEGGRYGVENFTDLQERVYNGLTELASRHEGQNIVAVSHGGSINAFLHRITDGKLGTGVTVIENASMANVVYEKKAGWKVIDVNQTGHLEEGNL